VFGWFPVCKKVVSNLVRIHIILIDKSNQSRGMITWHTFGGSRRLGGRR